MRENFLNIMSKKTTSRLSARGERILQFIKILREQDGIITEFDDALWGSMVEFVTIGKASRSVTFKDGTEIQV